MSCEVCPPVSLQQVDVRLQWVHVLLQQVDVRLHTQVGVRLQHRWVFISNRWMFVSNMWRRTETNTFVRLHTSGGVRLHWVDIQIHINCRGKRGEDKSERLKI